MKVDGFLIAMISAIGLALLWPGLGASGGVLHLATITNVGIGFVFFLHGANLSPQSLRSGAAHWRLHLLVQSTTFILFPIAGGLLWMTTGAVLPEEIRLGFFYLCALPSTISSSVAMTAMARGNVAVAVFNATLSGLLGMVVTPLLIGLVVTMGVGGPSIGESIMSIVETLLLPFALGQVARPLIGALLALYKKLIGMLDRGVIVLIVYGSFCESTQSGLWTRFSFGTFALIAAGVLVFLLLALGYNRMMSRLIGLNPADEAAAVFCGSKKSLANGAPMAKILFAHNPSVGLIMLPLLFYHQLQLIVCAAMARRYASRAEAKGACAMPETI